MPHVFVAARLTGDTRTIVKECFMVERLILDLIYFRSIGDLMEEGDGVED